MSKQAKKYLLVLVSVIWICCCCIGMSIIAAILVNAKNTANAYVQIPSSNPKCTFIWNTSNNKTMVAEAAKHYHCDKLAGKSFNLVDLNPGNNIEVSPYYEISFHYDTLNPKVGQLAIYTKEGNNFPKVAEFEIGRPTTLDVGFLHLLNNRYLFFSIISITGKDLCSAVIDSQLYPYCVNLEKDLQEFGGIWMYDIETKQIQRLHAFTL